MPYCFSFNLICFKYLYIQGRDYYILLESTCMQFFRKRAEKGKKKIKNHKEWQNI